MNSLEKIGGCGYVGIGVVLLEVCHQGWALKFQKPTLVPVSVSLSLCLNSEDQM